MTGISTVVTVTPEHSVQACDLPDVSTVWLAGDEVAQQKFLRIGAHSGVTERRFILPYREILALGGLAQRTALFEEYGVTMLSEVIEGALGASGVPPEEYGALVFTSCSVPSIPAIDAAAVLRSSLPTSISRIPIFQHGCAGGVVGLGLGAKLAALGSPVLVASVELCSLVFQPGNSSGAHLVGAAIFADGAAATTVLPMSSTLEIVRSASHLLPDTRHLMGYDLFDDGFHLRLDRALPSVLLRQAGELVQSFLDREGLELNDISYWLFHPGGIKILDLLREHFELSIEQCRWSYDVLREDGNMSSATVLFVLNKFFESHQLKPGERVMMMGIGPGLTIELILMEGS